MKEGTVESRNERTHLTSSFLATFLPNFLRGSRLEVFLAMTTTFLRRIGSEICTVEEQGRSERAEVEQETVEGPHVSESSTGLGKRSEICRG